jgi:multidrug efflux system outer membrane protein
MRVVRGVSVFLAAVLAILVSGCAVGPNYKRPAIDTPQGFRNDTSASATSATAASFGDEKWVDVLQDLQLQALIHTALERNFDVRIAASRIAQAQAQVMIARSNELPGAAALVSGTGTRNAQSKFFGEFETSDTELGLGFQWNLDFWGKYRRATESARDQLLASDWDRRVVISSLVASVASAYFTLREQDLELQISRETLASDQDSLRLTQLLVDHGRTSLLDVRQAEQLVYGASGSISVIQRQMSEQEDLISTLLGENPGDVTRGMELTVEPHAAQVPAGMPSSLLERRPDIREAEAQLMSMNAQIGVAKAAYFPSISLTGEGGLESTALSNLFTSPSGLWNLVGQLSQPLFAGGSLKGNVHLAQAAQQQAVLTYQQTIQQAFRQVSDALVAYTKDQDFRGQQELLTQSAQDASRLSDLRYRGGATSYLEVLDANTRYYAAELTLAQAQLNVMLDYVELYRALGGGWQQ